MKNNRILLTGATGLLGRYILRELLTCKNNSIFILVRPLKGFSAEERFRQVLQYLFIDVKDFKKYHKYVTLLEGDHLSPNFGLTNKEFNNLKNNVAEIYHSAALAEFRQPLERVRQVNVYGTLNVLNFANQCPNLNKLNHVSTAFIAGNFKGLFLEDHLNVKQKFNNTYEQSKFEAEILLNKLMNKHRKGNRKFDIVIYRPSIVVGELKNGKTCNFRMFYQPFRSLSKGVFKKIPLNINTVLNLIPPEEAARKIVDISRRVKQDGTYHILGSPAVPVVRLMELASDYFKFKLPKFVPIEKFDFNELTPLQRVILEPYFPYFNFRALFDYQNTVRVLRAEAGGGKIDDKFIKRLFRYAKQERFIL